MTSGHFMSAPPGAHGYSAYGPIAKFDNALPDGLLGAAAYLQGLGGVAKRAVWNLNVLTYTVNDTCDAIQMISQLPGQQEPGVRLELGTLPRYRCHLGYMLPRVSATIVRTGNEFYISSQGRPKFPNSGVYAEYVAPIVACARQLMPKALVAAVGCAGAWNQGLKAHAHLFDGVTIHNYSPRTADSLKYQHEGDRMSWCLPRSRTSAHQISELRVLQVRRLLARLLNGRRKAAAGGSGRAQADLAHGVPGRARSAEPLPHAGVHLRRAPRLLPRCSDHRGDQSAGGLRGACLADVHVSSRLPEVSHAIYLLQAGSRARPQCLSEPWR